MTGSLLAPLALASPPPVRPVAPNYSVDSFSEYSTRTVNRATCSPSSVTSGSRSARAKEEDEELFRDLFAGETDVEASEEASQPVWSAAPTFLPQKPVTQRAPALNGNPNPRKHLAPMKPVPPQPVISMPFIPRLKLEELVNARPDDDEDDNNKSQRTSRRGSELEQVTEEDEHCFDDDPNDGKVAAPSKAQVLNRGFNGSLRLISNNQRSSNTDKLEQETLRFLEKLDLKAVLHTPRPDILSFYPGMATTPIAPSVASPYSKMPGAPEKLPEDGFTEDFGKDLVKEKVDAGFREAAKASRTDGAASRLAYMESTYGTAPIVRKTRRGTIDRLANPISGHTSTLQALSPRRREKREALTSRAPLSPISAAIAVSCRRGTTSKKGRTLPVKATCYTDIPVSTLAPVKRKASKRQDPLVQKRRSNTAGNTQARGQGPTISGLTKRKSKTTLTLAARKEALKKKLQTRPGATKRGGDRKIGGATFLTQRDDEEGVERIEEFITRHRGAAQAPLTFRSGNKVAPRMPALPSRKPSTTRLKARPQPPQVRAGVPFARVSGASKGRRARELEILGNVTDRTHQRPRVSTYTARSGADHERSRVYAQPRRPQAWQATPAVGRSTTSGGVTNPLRKLKVHPTMPTLLPRAPKTPPSAATTLLMGSAPRFSLLESIGGETKSTHVPRRGSKKPLTRTLDGVPPRTSFDAPTKISEQRKRSSTTARPSGAGKTSGTRHPAAVRRSTSRL